MKPPYQAITVAAISLPRRWAGANSAISGQPTEYSVPIATPISSRTTNSSAGESTKNCMADAIANSADVEHEQRLTAELVGGPAADR